MTEATTYVEHSPHQLAGMADCMSPDSADSAGATWLLSVEQDYRDQLAGDQWDEDSIHEVADSAVPVYTHERWRVFVDLGAYQEDVTDLGADGSDLTQCAGVALYMIAERLLLALHEDEDDSDEDED